MKLLSALRPGTVVLILLLAISAVSAAGLMSVLASDGETDVVVQAPVFTVAPTFTVGAPPPAVSSAATPVAAQAAGPDPADSAAALYPEVPLFEPTTDEAVAAPSRSPEAGPAEVSRPEATPEAAPTGAVGALSGVEGLLAAPAFRLYLGLVLSRYQPPPREMEPFQVLPAFPAADWPTASATTSLSKLGLHAVSTGDPYAMEFIRRARPRVVKAVGDYGWLAEVKQVSPEIVTIGRTLGQEGGWVLTLDPAVAAELYIQQHLDQYRLNPFVDYWEGWNEFIFGPAEELRWFAQFEAERACQMQALGYRAAVGGFAVGWPRTYPEMELFLPALEAAQRCGGLFHLHEYNKPLLHCAVQTGLDEIIPGAPALRVPAGPLTFRYRFWYEGLLKPRGLGDLPLVISEYGIDAVTAIGCADPDSHGARTWKHYAAWWTANGFGVDGPAAYVNQLAWADREMRHDGYVLGATLFTVGATDSGSQWNGWDIHDVLIPLAHYLVTQR